MTHENERCGNPDCPDHGTSERAQATRRALVAIKTNGELMDMIRILAANVNDATVQEVQKMGMPVPMEMSTLSIEILKGNEDDDPCVVGIVRGMAVLLMHSEQIQTLLEATKPVPEPYVVERLRRQGAAERPSFEEFVESIVAQLKGGR